MLRNHFSFTFFLIAVASSGFAQQTVEPGAGNLEEVVVIASRIPQPLSEVAAQVSVIDAGDIERSMAEDIDDLAAYQPGLDVEVNGSRFGASSTNIRGIGGNRVEIEQDGIPVTDRFSVGSFADSGRGLAGVDLVKRVEVLHGPASVMYGSNAIAGVITVTTWDPHDLLDRSDGTSFYAVRGGYRTVDDAWVGLGMAAWGDGMHGLLLSSTFRNGHERDNQGGVTDPQDWNSQDAMLRYTYDTDSGGLLRLTVAGQNRETNTEIFSLLGSGRFSRTTRLQGIDQVDSQRYSLDYEFSWRGWERGVVRAFRAENEVDQLTLEERSPATALRRQYFYNQEHTGLDINLFRKEAWGDAVHRIGIGFEWLSSDSEELRDGLQTDLATGNTSNVILGEEFPLRDFPLSTSDEMGLFVQDEIELADGRWRIIPALRWDRYDLGSNPDDIWRDDFPDTEVVDISDSQFTSRLGVVYSISGDWSVYGQYAQGFRAPPFEDVNIGLDIPLFGIRAIANPDLESETSDGFEAGVRYITADTSFNLAAFHTDYDDFIETRVFIGVDPATGDLLFQSRNIDSARIRGFDIRYEQSLEAWNPALKGWQLHAAAYWAEGDNRSSGQPLNSIAPPQAVLGLTWTSPDGQWDIAVNGVFTRPKRESDIDNTSGERFATPGWGSVDITAGWRAHESLELRAGVFNLGDNSYWRWLDVANLAAGDPLIPVLSRPGRNFSVSARWIF